MRILLVHDHLKYNENRYVENPAPSEEMMLVAKAEIEKVIGEKKELPEIAGHFFTNDNKYDLVENRSSKEVVEALKQRFRFE